MRENFTAFSPILHFVRFLRLPCGHKEFAQPGKALGSGFSSVGLSNMLLRSLLSVFLRRLISQ